MDFLYLIFYACLRLRFLDVETNPGPRRPVRDVCRIVCSNVRGLTGNLSDLTVASSRYDILLCSGLRYASRVELLDPGLLLLLLLLKRLAMKGREREIDTLSVRRPQPHTTNL